MSYPKDNCNMAGLLVCPICEEATGVAITRRLDKCCPPKLYDEMPCEMCFRKNVMLFDEDTNDFIGGVPKEVFFKEMKDMDKYGVIWIMNNNIRARGHFLENGDLIAELF